MHWVWTQSRSGPTERLVLLAIADCANDQGQAWPSMAALVEKTRLGERTVQRAVATLVDLGELAAVIGGGRGRTTKYRLLLPESESETPSEKPRQSDARQRNPVSESKKPRQPRQETPSETTVNPATAAPGTVKNHQGTTKEPSGGAETLIAEWLEHCLKRPPSSVVNQVGKQVHALLAEGIDRADVRRGLALWHDKGLHPSTLPSVVNEAMNGRASPSGLVPHGALRIRPETAQRIADRQRFAAMDEARARDQQKAIEGGKP